MSTAAHAAAVAEERTIQLPTGLKIATKVWGSGASQGRPERRILALHGYLDNANTYDLLGPALAQEGYEVVAMDFAGHGLSGHTCKDNWYSLLDYPEWVIGVERMLGWDKCVLLGHSLGAGVASLVAGSFPERTQSCVFIDGLGPFTLSTKGAHAHLRRAVESRATLHNKQQKIWPSRELAVEARMLAATQYPGNQTLSQEAAERLIARSTEPVNGDSSSSDGKVKFRYDLRLRAYSSAYLDEEGVRAFLSNIQCQCLLLTGETGMPLTGAFEERKACMGPDRLLHTMLPGSHHLHLDRSSFEGVRAAVVHFLQEQSDAAAAAADDAVAARQKGAGGAAPSVQSKI